MITIGTDCSGIEAPIEALKQLGIPYQHKWSCEIDKFARKSIMANHPPEIMYEDITERDHSQLPDVDFYICGFPCQSFSLMGKQLGTKDPRGNIMLHCIDVIKKKQPPVFILENVKNFKFIENGRPFNRGQVVTGHVYETGLKRPILGTNQCTGQRWMCAR
jgi:DNA (cytosine-5)-methyltransferase 1